MLPPNASLGEPPGNIADVSRAAMRKVYLRLLPFTIIAYLLSYIDRINVGFAALTMNADLGLDPATFGMAAGMFFWGYFLFEVPSNLLLQKIGARVWIARIMISWGVLAAATAFAVGPKSFLVIRFLLGLAEAGFFPGIVVLLMEWFPESHRARVMSLFSVAIPLSLAACAPISTALLSLDGLAGLKGWQWMFIAEGLPTVILGGLTLVWLTNSPAKAKFLTDQEAGWLIGTLRQERKGIDAGGTVTWARSLLDPRVIRLAAIYFGILTASLGLLLFLPQIIKQLGLSNMGVGWVTAGPYIIGTIGMVVFGAVSDRLGNRRVMMVLACVLSGVGLLVCARTLGSCWSLVGLSIATVGFYGIRGPFWAAPGTFLTGTSAAAAVAWINSIGNLGGFFGPSLVGIAKSYTGDFTGGVYLLAGFAFLSAVLAVVPIRRT